MRLRDISAGGSRPRMVAVAVGVGLGVVLGANGSTDQDPSLGDSSRA